MRRRAILKLDDLTLDHKVHIQGTQFDRKRKLSNKDLKKIQKYLMQGVRSLEELAILFEVDKRTLRYHLDPEYRLKRIAQSTGKHTGTDIITFEDRVAYKRRLIKKRRIKAKTVV